jgi:toxin HigB-1
MEIKSISRKALKRFFLTGNSKGLVGDVERLRAMLALIAAAASLDELARPPNYGLHRLTGNRAGTWPMTVTRNWRLTFAVTQKVTVTDMDLEDYHGS